MTNAEQKHKSEILAEIKGMPGRQSILRRLDEETNTTVRIWIWEYLQSDAAPPRADKPNDLVTRLWSFPDGAEDLAWSLEQELTYIWVKLVEDYTKLPRSAGVPYATQDPDSGEYLIEATVERRHLKRLPAPDERHKSWIPV